MCSITTDKDAGRQRTLLALLRKRTVERYTGIVNTSPGFSWGDILNDLETVQGDVTRVGSKCYTTVKDFESHVEKTPRLKALFSKPNPPKKKCSRTDEYYRRNPAKYQAHLEKTKLLKRTPEYIQHAREVSINQRKRAITVNRYISMIQTRGHMSLEEILADLKSVQGELTVYNNPRYTTVEDFEKYIGNKIKLYNTYDKDKIFTADKLAELIIKI